MLEVVDEFIVISEIFFITWRTISVGYRSGLQGDEFKTCTLYITSCSLWSHCCAMIIPKRVHLLNTDAVLQLTGCTLHHWDRNKSRRGCCPFTSIIGDQTHSLHFPTLWQFVCGKCPFSPLWEIILVINATLYTPPGANAGMDRLYFTVDKQEHIYLKGLGFIARDLNKANLTSVLLKLTCKELKRNWIHTRPYQLNDSYACIQSYVLYTS